MDGLTIITVMRNAGVETPVLMMTALAMIIGMAPIAMSEGQNAPLGRAVIGGLIGAGAAVIAIGVFSRVHANQTLKAWTNAQAIPTVNVILPNASGEARTLALPGDVQAFNSAAIHARVSGYLKAWDADISASVKAGQLLAEVDAPDLDQQLAQAKADLGSAVANETLAKSIAQRWTWLLAKDAVSHQGADEKTGDLAAKRLKAACVGWRGSPPPPSFGWSPAVQGRITTALHISHPLRSSKRRDGGGERRFSLVKPPPAPLPSPAGGSGSRRPTAPPWSPRPWR